MPGVVLPLVAVQLAKSFGLELRELKRITAGGALLVGGVGWCDVCVHVLYIGTQEAELG